eukprot:2907079-Amphidinium_carterae.1
MEKYPCSANTIPVVDRDASDQYGRYLKQGTVDMWFYYLAEGRKVGSMTVQDIWFERRFIREDGSTNGKNKDVMLTAYTAKGDADPYNGNGIVEPPTDQAKNDSTGSASAAAT